MISAADGTAETGDIAMVVTEIEAIIEETNGHGQTNTDSVTERADTDSVTERADTDSVAECANTDGPRAKHLKQALRKALNNTIKSCSGEKLDGCFPFNLKPAQMAAINSTIVAALQSVIDGVQTPFETLIREESLLDRLNRVDEFSRSRVLDATPTSSTPLSPQNLVDRKLHATKLAALSQLEQHVQKLETDNGQLTETLHARQRSMAERLDRLKSSQQLLDAALDQMSSISMEDLEELVDKMNHQYQPGAITLPSLNLPVVGKTEHK